MDNEQSIDEIELNTEVDQESVPDSVSLQTESLQDEAVTDDGDGSESEGIVLDDEDILKEEESSNDLAQEVGPQEGVYWYIIQCYALYEQKVRDHILQMQEDEFKDVIFRVLLPEEETVEIKNNERKEKVKKMFPGYLFVQMKPDEGVWYMLRRLPGVAKLVGTKNEPTPVSEDEINRILRQLGEKMKKIEVDFELNEVIKVISGPFRGYTGAISEINAERGKLKSLISIFGRETPVELDFDQVEKYVDNK